MTRKHRTSLTKQWEKELNIPINPFYQQKDRNGKKILKKSVKFNPQNNIREFNFSNQIKKNK